MIDYGSPPAADTAEVTLFGPGYGEAVAVHLGDSHWLLVDSCIDPEAKKPASAAYLEQLGVAADSVQAIVASHWHDDHVGGISRLATQYPAALFFLPGVFSKKEALAFLAGYKGTRSSDLARGMGELYAVTQQRETLIPALHRTILLETKLNARPVRVTALSPLPAAFAQALAHLAESIPKQDDSIRHAPELRPNYGAVALHIDLDDDAILLGADLEEHNNYGWSAVVADTWSGQRTPATVYKVAHHGSKTGHCAGMWQRLLRPDPMACLTPFTRGRQRLPTEEDRSRLKEHTRHVYISSGASRRPVMDSRILKRLNDIATNVAQVDAGFGVVRLRKAKGTPAWTVDLFGSAGEVA